MEATPSLDDAHNPSEPDQLGMKPVLAQPARQRSYSCGCGPRLVCYTEVRVTRNAFVVDVSSPSAANPGGPPGTPRTLAVHRAPSMPGTGTPVLEEHHCPISDERSTESQCRQGRRVEIAVDDDDAGFFDSNPPSHVWTQNSSNHPGTSTVRLQSMPFRVRCSRTTSSSARNHPGCQNPSSSVAAA